jgi:hypothetical protein
MTRATLICLGLFFIVVLILLLVFRTPSTEGFEAPALTTCPPGFTMYMYEGTAYCCKGTVNRDALSLEKTCMSPVTDMDNSFCTLNTGTLKIPNCSSLTNSILASKGSSFCPPSKPNHTTTNKCCTSALTSDNSDCANNSAGSCIVVEGSPFTVQKGTTTCQYQAMKEKDSCPSGTNMTETTVSSGMLSGLTIYGCSTLTNTCYTSTLLTALKAAGKDTTGLRDCSEPIPVPSSISCSNAADAAAATVAAITGSH